MKTERVLEHAEVTAVFFRALVDRGVPVAPAAQLTASYVSTVVITEASGEKPREPWQDGGLG